MRIRMCTSNENSTTLATFGRYLLEIGDGNASQDDNIDLDGNDVVLHAQFDDFCKIELSSPPNTTAYALSTTTSLITKIWTVIPWKFSTPWNWKPPSSPASAENWCLVILLRNLDPRKGLCNGARLMCRWFSNAVIKVNIASGRHSGSTALIPRVKLSLTASSSPIPFEPKHFPLTLSFGITVNKTKGQTLSSIGYIFYSLFCLTDSCMLQWRGLDPHAL